MAAKTVLITGSSSGFGRAAALLFRKTGWRVAATMMNTDEWKEAGTSDDLLVLPLNVEDLESIKNAIDRTIERFAKIDCVVNNAGKGMFSSHFDGVCASALRNKCLWSPASHASRSSTFP
jgi:NAD(P)-dependent dehydrogenase (short-subunit alcohol dehydrogenase family)